MQVKREKRGRVIGVGAIAAELELSTGHVSQVLNGKRGSMRVLRVARRHGVLTEAAFLKAARKARRGTQTEGTVEVVEHGTARVKDGGGE